MSCPSVHISNIVTDLSLDESIGFNSGMKSTIHLSGWTLLKRDFYKKSFLAADAQVHVKAEDKWQSKARNLSGGNQQRLILGNLLAKNPRALVLDEITCGVDIMTKQEILRMIRERVDQTKCACLFISSEWKEVFEVSDRVIVMHDGRILGELGNADFSEQKCMELIAAAAG